MVVLAFLTDPSTVHRILTHLGLPTSPPPIAPARDPFDDPEPEPESFPDDGAFDDRHPTAMSRAGRDPPATE